MGYGLKIQRAEISGMGLITIAKSFMESIKNWLFAQP